MKKDEKGFSAIEVIIVIVIVGLLGTVGWVVYDRQHNNKKENTQPNNSQSTQETKKSEDTTSEQTYKGKRYTSSKGAFSIELLNGWTVQTDTTYDYIFQYSVSNLKYNEANVPIITETDASGVGGFVPGIMVSINEYNQEINSGDKFTLNDGTIGYCKSTVTTKEEDDGDLMADNMGNFISKDCFFKKNNQKLSAQYSYYEKELLDTKAVEYSFKTIKFEK